MSIAVGIEYAECRSCKAKIVWMLTKNEKPIPVDAETVQFGDSQFDPKRHKSHFASCPFASEHRKKPEPTLFESGVVSLKNPFKFYETTKECNVYNERAAIMEFDGKLPRDEAERLARLAHPKNEDEPITKWKQ